MQDGDLADRAVVVAQCGDGFDDFQQAGALVQRDAHFLALLGRGLLGGADQVVAAAADGHEADAGRVQTLQAGVGGEAAVEDQEAQWEAAGVREVEELEHRFRAGRAADGRVGAQQQAGIGILRQGCGKAGQGAAARAGPVFLQGLIVAPVGQGGEVQIGAVRDQLVVREDARQRGQQGLVHGAGGAVGVGGEPGRLGQHVEAGEEAGAAVHAPDVVGTVAADVGQLEGEEAEHRLQRGEGVGAGVASAFDGFVNAVAAQQGQEAEHTGGAGGLEQFRLEGVERHTLRSLHRRGAGRGAGRPGAAREAGEALAVEDGGNGAFAGGLVAGGVELGLDVGHGQIELAQADDCGMRGGGRRGREAAGRQGVAKEEVSGCGQRTKVTDDGIDGVAGALEAAGDLGGREILDEEGAEDFVASLARMGGLVEEGARIGEVGRCGRIAHIRHYITCETTRYNLENTDLGHGATP